ncbi:TPA: integrase domain-containing protein [Aeromonas salmonicida subsp. pectinolytica]
MARCDRENPDARNYGLGSRDLNFAGQNALREGMLSHGSIATMADRWSLFAAFSKQDLGVSDMRKIDTGHLQQYAAHLRDRLERGEIGPATAQNLLSTVNRVMEIARGDRAVRLDPVREAGLPERSGVATTDRSVSQADHQSALAALPERLGAMLELQRGLGLRFEESAKMDARAALAQAERTGQIRVERGTKGGLSRDVPIIRPEQVESLRQAAALQGGDRSMIPDQQSYGEFRAEAYQQIRAQSLQCHGERHSYAQERYAALTGVACPVAAGIEHGRAHIEHIAVQQGISVQEALALDQEARLQVASELGHGRVDVTNAYLG